MQVLSKSTIIGKSSMNKATINSTGFRPICLACAGKTGELIYYIDLAGLVISFNNSCPLYNSAPATVVVNVRGIAPLKKNPVR